MNQDWKIINLGKICDVLDSKRKPITKRDRIPGDYPYYGATGIVDWVNDYIFDEQLILLGEDGAKWDSGERSAFNINGKTWVNNHAHVLRPHRDVVKDNWLVYYLNHQSLLPFITGLTVPKLNQGKMRGIPILVPPLPEQKRIVTKLDKCFEAIDKARANVEKNLNNIKELVTSVGKNIYSSIGSANNQTIDELTDLVTDYVANGSFASLKENVTYRVEKSYAILIRLVDHSNRFEGNFVYIDKHSYDFLAKSKLEPNDIILSNVGARLGTVFKAPDLGMPMSLAPNSILLKSKDYGEYLFCWIKSKYGQKKIKNIVGGAGQPKFNKTDFKKIIVPMPTDKSEREEIVSKIYRTEKKYQALESNYQQELDALDELKKSILEKAFNGEL